MTECKNECIIDNALEERNTKLLENCYRIIVNQEGIRESLNQLNRYCELAYNHGIRVCRRIIMIGILKDYPVDKIVEMGTAGILLDIGYIEIPKDYLAKRTTLNKSEFSTIKKHPLISKRMAQDIQLNETIQQYILDHHESGDGNGYPRQQGKRIMGVEQSEINLADKYEALLENRPYRPPMDHEKAVQTIYYMCNTNTELKALRTLILTAKCFS